MPHDADLADRVRRRLARRPGVVEKAMFGGVAFLLHGNMSVGIHRDALIVRTSPVRAAEALQQPGVRVFDITGRPMKGWLMVGPEALETDDELARWVAEGLAFATTLPPKA